jgi:hypothetical protein
MAVGHFSRLGAHLLQEHFSIYDPMQRTSFQQLLPPRVAAWRLGLGGVVGARCRWARRARGAGRTHTRHPTPHTPTRHCDGVRCGSKYFLLLTNIIPQKPTQSLREAALRTTARTSRVHMQAKATPRVQRRPRTGAARRVGTLDASSCPEEAACVPSPQQPHSPCDPPTTCHHPLRRRRQRRRALRALSARRGQSADFA